MKNMLVKGSFLVIAAVVLSTQVWGQVGFEPGQSMKPAEALKAAAEGGAPISPTAAGAMTQAGKPVEWIPIHAGKFMMGSYFPLLLNDKKPEHEVSIPAFEMSRTLVTVGQYAECVRSIDPETGAPWCKEPDRGGDCTWGKTDRDAAEYPITCVNWAEAVRYAEFKAAQPGFEGARLPSESEWEYAARSGGKDQEYPWGDEEATCERAVMKSESGEGGLGCGTGGALPVCSRTAGNTKIDGLPAGKQLCDMAGDVLEWVQDKYQPSYEGAPSGGKAFEPEGLLDRVMRGGSFYDNVPASLRAGSRFAGSPTLHYSGVGFRLARSSR